MVLPISFSIGEKMVVELRRYTGTISLWGGILLRMKTHAMRCWTGANHGRAARRFMCNSLHTNVFDEAITTPSSESVRRAVAIQLIINKEWGLSKNENPNQGSFIIDELTELVEEAVLSEFERLSERGGVLGAMETGYQRGKIQDESLYYEQKKHDGSLPIVGVNTFLKEDSQELGPVELSRSTEEEKQSQLKRLRDFQARDPEKTKEALERIKQAAMHNENVFAELMHAVRWCSLGQITQAMFEVGGQYRRTM